ncbi:hypothetical protein PPERSA_09523 [Pseudocohnilembus persalinus]|uniref:Uncharacterized protein n=1 Tax=Pseudocohnilembus persalinus TaxID=266149 RepID=A0A0V0QFI8_PSEPJ|nr:hypothetical protein PPERSA_09523 [Pseudocohnilembus persalinus]|eukprot:KRX00917.1 hypothetical protein PPERSA_09523 [Pseudocohnilembus persalinus]
MEDFSEEIQTKTVSGYQIQQDEQDSQQDKQEVQGQQNFTYYYSSFELFDEITEFSFIRYQRFVQKLHHYLGGDWEVYASNSVFQMLEDVKKYLTYDEVFDIALQSWLETQNNYKKQRKNSSCEDLGTIESQNRDEIPYQEESDIFEQFLVRFKQNLNSYQINNAFFKPVAHGFFMSAVEIWNETIRSIKNQRVFSENSLYELGQQKEKELEEQMQKEKNLQLQQKFGNKQNSGDSYIEKLYQKVQTIKQKNQIIKPLIVASETIIGYLGAKKVKESNQNSNKKQSTEEQDEEDYQKMNQAQQKNFNCFKDNLLSEEEVVMQKIRKISMQEQTLNRKRKQAELQMEQESSNSLDESQSMVSVDNFPKKAEKLNEQVYNFATNYFYNIKKNTQEKWQVARSFVTNIIELNNNILSKTQKISSEYTSSIKIRFLQPAQQFYNHLMEIWILFRQNQSSTNDFKLYLEKVKASMGSRWSETYVLPTQYFFKTLVYTWDSLVKEQKESIDEDALIKIFVERVRSNMLNNWENDIVNKIKLFKNGNNKQQTQQQKTKEERKQEHQQFKNQFNQMQNQNMEININNNNDNFQQHNDNLQEQNKQQKFEQNINLKEEEQLEKNVEPQIASLNQQKLIDTIGQKSSQEQQDNLINQKMEKLNIQDCEKDQEQEYNQQIEQETYKLKKIMVDDINKQQEYEQNEIKIEEN